MYPKLQGKCAEYIHKGWCTGCNKLEDINFIGNDQCEWILHCENILKKFKKDLTKN